MRLQLLDMDVPAEIFVDLVELDDLSAEGLVHSLLSSLQRHHFTKQLMFRHKSGVVARKQA